jgi:pimeloyl-ACP methyl ester carboxylesterase
MLVTSHRTSATGTPWLLAGAKFIAALFSPFVLVAAAGLCYQSAASWKDWQVLQPPGKLYDAGGSAMHLYCTGSGSPTVILEAGAAAFSSMWAWVQADLASSHRVCSYDRAGMGWSRDSTDDHSGAASAHRLLKTLRAANEHGPYILVGHSFGAVLVLILAAQDTNSVAGLVMIDPPYPAELTRLPAEAKAKIDSLIGQLRYALWASRFGLVRAVGGVDSFASLLPPRAHREVAMFASDAQHLKSSIQELQAWDATMTEARKAMQSLGCIPLTVVSTDVWPNIGRPGSAILALLRGSQAALAQLARRGQYVTLHGTDHFSVVMSEKYARRTAALIRGVANSPATNCEQLESG